MFVNKAFSYDGKTEITFWNKMLDLM